MRPVTRLAARTFRAALRAGLCTLPLLTGCSLAHFSDVSSSSSVLPAMLGSVHGGQQPVSGATIGLYAANILANKGASLSLLTTATTTDGNGSFSITGKYACPTPNSPVYLTSTGGNPGLAAGTNNAGIAMMTALGTCGQFFVGGDSIHVTINELTTVAAIEALAPYIADLTHIGADTTANPNALTNAFAAANAAVAYSFGQFATQPANSNFPFALYNTLANIAASCINTAGNTGSTTNCYKFYNANTVAADTFAALLSLVQNPANTNPFTLAGGTAAPFQPALTSAPPTFVPGLQIMIPTTGEVGCCTKQQLAIDTSQQIWVGNTYTKGVHVYSNQGALLYTLTLPQQLLKISADGLGNVWMLIGTLSNGGSPGAALMKYSSSGTLLSPAAGYPTVVGAGPQLYTYQVAGTDGADLKLDSLGNAYVTGQSLTTFKACLLKYSALGTYLQPFCTTSSPSYHASIVVDNSDNVYLSNISLYKFNSAGVSQFATPVSFPSSGDTYTMSYDSVLDRLWVFNGTNAFILKTDGTVVKNGLAGGLYSINSSTNQPVGPFGLDGAGNGFICCTFQFGLTRYDPTGLRTSPDFAVTNQGTYVGGFGAQGLAIQLLSLQVDALGNIWGVGDNNMLWRLGGGIAVPRAQFYK